MQYNKYCIHFGFMGQNDNNYHLIIFNVYKKVENLKLKF